MWNGGINSIQNDFRQQNLVYLNYFCRKYLITLFSKYVAMLTPGKRNPIYQYESNVIGTG
jgi:hypothetical protein